MAIQRIEEALSGLVAAYQSNSKEDYFSRFTDDSSIVLYTAQGIFKSRSEFELEWLAMKQQGFEVIECLSSDVNISVHQDVAIAIHNIDTIYLIRGERFSSADTETVVFKYDGDCDRWLVCHEHISPRAGS